MLEWWENPIPGEQQESGMTPHSRGAQGSDSVVVLPFQVMMKYPKNPGETTERGILSRPTLSLNPPSPGHLNIPKLLQHIAGFLQNPGKRVRIAGKGMIFLPSLQKKRDLGQKKENSRALRGHSETSQVQGGSGGLQGIETAPVQAQKYLGKQNKSTFPQKEFPLEQAGLELTGRKKPRKEEKTQKKEKTPGIFI